MVPGETAFTRIVGPYSSAAVDVSAMTPAFAVRRPHPTDRGRIHDASVARPQHDGCDRLDAVKHTDQVDVDDAAKCVGFHRLEPLTWRDTGVVVENGNPTHRALGCGDGGRNLVPIGHIDLEGMSTNVVGHSGSGVSVLVEDGH